MSGVEAIPLIIAGVELLVTIVEKLIDKAEEKKELRESINYFYNYAIHIDRSTLKTLSRRAEIVLYNPTVTDADKKNLKDIMALTKQNLEAIEKDLNKYLGAANNPFSREKKKSLVNIARNSRSLTDHFKKFDSTLASQEVLGKTSEHLLNTHDFDVRPDNPKIWIAESTCIATGRLSRPINGVEAGEHSFLLEVRRYGQTKKAKEDARMNTIVMNQHLAAAEHTEGIPKVLGFREEEDEDGAGRGEFQLVMWFPNITPPTVSNLATLRGSLSSVSDIPPLNDRVNLCAALAEAVLHVHRLGLVHKNIRPETILLHPDPNTKPTSTIDAKLYLVGWQFARQTRSYQTRKVGEDTWERGIYQHPKRQGKHAESEYCMGHDIYSLGVCMLEVLYWHQLVEPHDADSDPLVGKAFKDAFFALGLDKQESPQPFNSEAEWITNDPQSVKNTLLKMVDTHVPMVAGTRMTDTIKRCLNCLDKDGEDAEHDKKMKEYQVLNQKEVGADFVDDILTEIQGVSCAI